MVYSKIHKSYDVAHNRDTLLVFIHKRPNYL